MLLGEIPSTNRDDLNLPDDWFPDDSYITNESDFQDIPIVHISKEEHKQLSLHWINCLIMKLLGKNMSRPILE